MNIVLIGMRGSGKTEIGKKIAEILSYNFFDLDTEITSKLNKNIAQIVSEKGWDYFRQKEAEICESISQNNNAVISTGGGIVLDEKNIDNLKKYGTIIFLDCDIKVLEKRLKNDIENRDMRPTLTDKGQIQELEQIRDERERKYINAADVVFDTSAESLDKTADTTTKAEQIIALIKAKGTI